MEKPKTIQFLNFTKDFFIKINIKTDKINPKIAKIDSCKEKPDKSCNGIAIEVMAKVAIQDKIPSHFLPLIQIQMEAEISIAPIAHTNSLGIFSWDNKNSEFCDTSVKWSILGIPAIKKLIEYKQVIK